jgi:hypothetical protein
VVVVVVATVIVTGVVVVVHAAIVHVCVKLDGGHKATFVDDDTVDVCQHCRITSRFYGVHKPTCVPLPHVTLHADNALVMLYVHPTLVNVHECTAHIPGTHPYA